MQNRDIWNFNYCIREYRYTIFSQNSVNFKIKMFLNFLKFLATFVFKFCRKMKWPKFFFVWLKLALVIGNECKNCYWTNQQWQYGKDQKKLDRFFNV